MNERDPVGRKDMQLDESASARLQSSDELVGRVFRHAFFSERTVVRTSRRAWQPPTDVYETQTAIVVKMEIPGVKEEDIKITLGGDRMIIQGRRYDSSGHTKVNFTRMEIKYGAFERIIILPEPPDESSIRPLYRDGFLEVSIPKSRRIKGPISIVIY